MALNMFLQLQSLAAFANQPFIVRGWMFFVASRLWMVCVSFLLDYSLFMLLQRAQSKAALQHMVMFASSWPVVVLCARPFSNTVEAVAVALVLALVTSKGSSRPGTCCAIAVCAVVGVWIRVTTVAFLAPSALHHLVKLLKAGQPALVVLNVAAVVIVAAALVLVDTRFYGGDSLHHNGTGHILTPWNLFVYNSNTSNLATHGLHPRVTHAVANMPMLMTAALPLLYRRVALSLWRLASGRLSWLHLDALLASTIVVGIMALSLFPHQEPRFLLPLLVPAFALLSPTSFPSSSRMRSIWAVCNVALFLFWGCLHQAALLPVLFSLSAGDNACAIAVAGTYSAPAAAVASCASIGQCSSVPVASLEGASVKQIDARVQAALLHRCVFIAAPASHPLCVNAAPETAVLCLTSWQVGSLLDCEAHLRGAVDILVAPHFYRVRRCLLFLSGCWRHSCLSVAGFSPTCMIGYRR